MSINAAGLEVKGDKNPNWKGGKVTKICAVCQQNFEVRPGYVTASYCSLQCAGIAQRGRVIQRKDPRKVEKACEECGTPFIVYKAHINRKRFCSQVCQSAWRAKHHAGNNNPNWQGGIGRLPYPWNFREMSKKILQRDQYHCQNPQCVTPHARLTTHHINFAKHDCRNSNLIALCETCNSKANFNRATWMMLYEAIQYARGIAPLP